jgi:hypothetical protein
VTAGISKKQELGRSSGKYKNATEMELENMMPWCGVEETFCVHYM